MRYLSTFLIIFVVEVSPAMACTEIAGDRITAAAMAAEVPAFASLDPGLDLGPAPLAGTTRTIRGFELQTLGENHGISLQESPPPVACFERASQMLTEEMLADALGKALDEPGASIQIVDFSRQPIPLGKLEFERNGLDSNGLWQGSLMYGKNGSVPVWARVQITGSQGEQIAFWPVAVNTAPEVVAGETIQVEVVRGQVLLAAAQSTGHRGETVLVQNPATGQSFSAIVQGPKHVRVKP